MKSFHAKLPNFLYLILARSFALMIFIRINYNANVYVYLFVPLLILIGLGIFISNKKVPIKIVINTLENSIQIKYFNFYRLETTQLKIDKIELDYDYKLVGKLAKEKILVILTSKGKYHLTPEHYIWNDNTINEIFNLLLEEKSKAG